MADQASKLKGLAWVVGALLLGASFATGLAPLMHAVPWKWEREIASWFPAAAPERICRENPAAEVLLNKLVARLFPLDAEDSRVTINVRVVNDAVVNAYAGLGGNIFIDTGLLQQAESPEELAGVLAHEIEHVKQRHILQNAAVRLITVGGLQIIFTGKSASNVEWLGYFFNMNFTRGQETQADEGGLSRLRDAHIDNRGFRAFFKRMEDNSLIQVFLSDHPENRKRYEMAGKFENIDTKPVMTPGEWSAFKNFCY